MKRVWRRTLNILTALSLILSLATAALWVRSYWVEEGYGWDEQTPYERFGIHHVGIVSNRGSLMFDRDNITDHPIGWERLDQPGLQGCVASTDFPELWTSDVPLPQRMLRRIGITYGYVCDGSMPVVDAVVFLPDWLVTLIFALPPSYAFFRWRKLHATFGSMP